MRNRKSFAARIATFWLSAGITFAVLTASFGTPFKQLHGFHNHYEPQGCRTGLMHNSHFGSAQCK